MNCRSNRLLTADLILPSDAMVVTYSQFMSLPRNKKLLWRKSIHTFQERMERHTSAKRIYQVMARHLVSNELKVSYPRMKGIIVQKTLRELFLKDQLSFKLIPIVYSNNILEEFYQATINALQETITLLLQLDTVSMKKLG